MLHCKVVFDMNIELFYINLNTAFINGQSSVCWHLNILQHLWKKSSNSFHSDSNTVEDLSGCVKMENHFFFILFQLKFHF